MGARDKTLPPSTRKRRAAKIGAHAAPMVAFGSREQRNGPASVLRAGRLTLPWVVRKHLGVVAGDRIGFAVSDTGGVTVWRRVTAQWGRRG